VGVACVAGLVFAAFTLWPNGEYRPIQKEERWTAGEALEKTRDIPSGRPGLTEERQEELGGAPAVAEESTTDAEETEGSEADPTPTPSATSRSGGGSSEATPTPSSSASPQG
jgi:hypothetical protein